MQGITQASVEEQAETEKVCNAIGMMFAVNSVPSHIAQSALCDMYVQASLIYRQRGVSFETALSIMHKQLDMVAASNREHTDDKNAKLLLEISDTGGSC